MKKSTPFFKHLPMKMNHSSNIVTCTKKMKKWPGLQGLEIYTCQESTDLPPEKFLKTSGPDLYPMSLKPASQRTAF